MKPLFKLMYIIVNSNSKGIPQTLSHYKKECISNFMEGSTMTWKECKKYGWKCEKVDVNIQSSSNINN